jgi:hypothetical protein
MSDTNTDAPNQKQTPLPAHIRELIVKQSAELVAPYRLQHPDHRESGSATQAAPTIFSEENCIAR